MSSATNGTRKLNALKLAFAAVRLIAVLSLVTFAYDWRSPLLTGVRPQALTALLTIPALVIALEFWLIKSGGRSIALRGLRIATFAVAGFVLIATASLEARFHWQRRQVLSTDAKQLERLGRHFVVGFRDWQSLTVLVERRAIAGIYVSAHNVRGLSIAEVRRNIDALQALRRQQGAPPLWVTTDQEGGGVSRLSPPLTYLPSLGEIVEKNADPAERKRAVEQYASTQARELAAAGINLNFAPVVDVNFRVVNANDRSTQIYKRAISDNAEIVSDVAATYCASLWAARVRCTLKHFPGLGRVSGDTHIETATLNAPITDLERIDWVPFRAIGRNDAVAMISHVRLAAIDGQNPASISRPVIDILRREWSNEGTLITDDFSMGAIYWSGQGITGSSIAALNAGVDLILISYDFDQFYPAMYALQKAERDGTLNAAALQESDRRLTLTKPLDH